jgi:aspartyl-tRNA(Asn)/glutamyl-tRNA(Gln) amidotransferase subunit A
VQADPTEASLAETIALVRRGALQPETLVEAYVDRIERFDGALKAYADRPSRSSLLAEARRVPAEGPQAALFGACLAPKDNFYTADLLTEGGSRVFEGFQPDYDATVVATMRAVGGLMVGKAQMGNLAGGRAQVYGTTTPTTRNAWTPDDDRYSPGGSSSGTATAVAARLAVAGLGTQTGGSVIGPGNRQGLTCIKPTFGRVSLHGVIPLSYTRDHVGRWPTRIGLWPGYLDQEDPAVNALRQALVDRLGRTGNVQIVPEIRLPDQWEELTAPPLGGSHGDPTAFFVEHLRRDVRAFGDRLPRFLNGMLQSADTYVKVQQARMLLLHRMQTQLFTQCDVVLIEGTGPFDGTGLPVLGMPIGTVMDEEAGREVPAGATVAALPFGEERLLAVAAAWQAVTDHHRVRPPDPVG